MPELVSTTSLVLLQHAVCKVSQFQLVKRRSAGSGARRNAPRANAADFFRGNTPVLQQASVADTGTGRTTHSSWRFDDHAYGAVDLEGENEEDDVRGKAVSEAQRRFLAEIDQSRREQQKQRRPRASKRAFLLTP